MSSIGKNFYWLITALNDKIDSIFNNGITVNRNITIKPVLGNATIRLGSSDFIVYADVSTDVNIVNLYPNSIIVKIKNTSTTNSTITVTYGVSSTISVDYNDNAIFFKKFKLRLFFS